MKLFSINYIILNKKQRNDIYQSCLNNYLMDENYFSGLCINIYKNIYYMLGKVPDEISPFKNLSQYPEIYNQKPEKESNHLNKKETLWFHIKDRNSRINILKNSINQIENLKR